MPNHFLPNIGSLHLFRFQKRDAHGCTKHGLACRMGLACPKTCAQASPLQGGLASPRCMQSACPSEAGFVVRRVVSLAKPELCMHLIALPVPIPARKYSPVPSRKTMKCTRAQTNVRSDAQHIRQDPIPSAIPLSRSRDFEAHPHLTRRQRLSFRSCLVLLHPSI
jgi:hypothetical protein